MYGDEDNAFHPELAVHAGMKMTNIRGTGALLPLLQMPCCCLSLLSSASFPLKDKKLCIRWHIFSINSDAKGGLAWKHNAPSSDFFLAILTKSSILEPKKLPLEPKALSTSPNALPKLQPRIMALLLLLQPPLLNPSTQQLNGLAKHSYWHSKLVYSQLNTAGGIADCSPAPSSAS